MRPKLAFCHLAIPNSTTNVSQSQCLLYMDFVFFRKTQARRHFQFGYDSFNFDFLPVLRLPCMVEHGEEVSEWRVQIPSRLFLINVLSCVCKCHLLFCRERSSAVSHWT